MAIFGLVMLRLAVTGKPVIFDPATYYGDREADSSHDRTIWRISHSFLQRLQRGLAVRQWL